MSLVQFRYRRSKPTNPVKGSFYWVELDDKTQIWFSPDGIEENLILLNGGVDESILTRVSSAEDEIETIKEVLAGIDLSEYVKAEDIPGLIDLTDSDYDIIVEKVYEKGISPLRWIKI